MPFTLGQRWISDTESELGLGTVVAIDARMVTLLFPATGENRLYARNDSPITRVMFNPGDTITSHEGWQMVLMRCVTKWSYGLYRNSNRYSRDRDRITRSHAGQQINL